MSTPHLLCLFISSHYVWTTRHGPCKHHVFWASLEISPHFFKAALVFHVLGTIYVSAEVHRHRVYFFLTISRFCFMCQWPWDSEQFAGSWGCAGLLIHCWSLNSLCCWKWGWLLPPSPLLSHEIRSSSGNIVYWQQRLCFVSTDFGAAGCSSKPWPCSELSLATHAAHPEGTPVCSLMPQADVPLIGKVLKLLHSQNFC